ncbi:hypothetical protein, partial [Rhizobium johnstonii]|uniref:hypothetical protein n=1 Tax=Rhizobium johnstonii TaxID=3019933 RepID=UPI003F9DBC54
MGAGGHDRVVRQDLIVRDPQADDIVKRLDGRDFPADDLPSDAYNSLGERESELPGAGKHIG